MKDVIHVGIVEDQVLFREGIKAIVGSWNDMDVVFECADGFSVVENLKTCDLLPDVLLVDLSLPPDGNKEFSGLDVTDAVIKEFPSIKLLILSVHEDENFIVQLIEHGAHGYLVKDCDPREVHEAIQAVHEKGSYINQRTLKALQHSLSRKRSKAAVTTLTPLTKREEEILGLICQQLTTDEMAERLFLSPKTVNGHRNHLLQKTGSRNTAGLVIYALKHHVVELI
jgi:two-component system, NarL family, response regulator NreC